MAKPTNSIDKSWQAESDARVLAEAHAISQDPGRVKAAAEKAKSMHERALQEAKSLKKVANKCQKTAKK